MIVLGEMLRGLQQHATTKINGSLQQTTVKKIQFVSHLMNQHVSFISKYKFRKCIQRIEPHQGIYTILD